MLIAASPLRHQPTPAATLRLFADALIHDAAMLRHVTLSLLFTLPLIFFAACRLMFTPLLRRF